MEMEEAYRFSQRQLRHVFRHVLNSVWFFMIVINLKLLKGPLRSLAKENKRGHSSTVDEKKRYILPSLILV